MTGVFFMTSRLPDCRHRRLTFAGIRYPELHYGISDPDPDPKKSWDKPHSILLTKPIWDDTLRDSLAAANNRGRVLLYVHGYFNDFDDPLQRAARLRTLYGSDVPTVVLSWPSRNRPQSYLYDEASLEWSQDHLDALVLQLAAMSEDVTIVGHSMGNRALVRAVERLDSEHPALGRKIRRIVLASPDIDRDQMLRDNGDLARLLPRPQDRHVLIYVSRRDRANGVSGALHGYSRLGSSDCDDDVAYANASLRDCHLTAPDDRLAIVDTSAAKADRFGVFRHADFIKSCAVRADLARFLRGQQAPLWRRAVTSPGTDLIGYRIAPELVPPGACD
jgi:esterase/lipase superfamily enzyme